MVTALIAVESLLSGVNEEGQGQAAVLAQVDRAIEMLNVDYNNDNSPHDFDGETYNPGRDHDRLKRQFNSVFKAMSDGQPHTLEELRALTGYPAASISARIRDYRKGRHGGWIVDRINRGGGLFAYRMRNPTGTLMPPVDPTKPGEDKVE
jgi:hypothetical protein